MQDTNESPATEAVDTPPPSVSSIPSLTAEECRVLGCLIEKQITTPEYYPMSLHALAAACNQKNNRAPLTAYEEKTVVRALDTLREKKLVSMIAEAGARVPKYKHSAAEIIGLDSADLAIVCELLVRGPQTVGELRNRADRMHAFADLAAVQMALDGLAARPQGALVARLPRQPGTKESRYTHLLSGPPPAMDAIQPPLPAEPARAEAASDAARLAKLEADTASLRAEIDAMKAAWEMFRKQFE